MNKLRFTIAIISLIGLYTQCIIADTIKVNYSGDKEYKLWAKFTNIAGQKVEQYFGRNKKSATFETTHKVEEVWIREVIWGGLIGKGRSWKTKKVYPGSKASVKKEYFGKIITINFP